MSKFVTYKPSANLAKNMDFRPWRQSTFNLQIFDTFDKLSLGKLLVGKPNWLDLKK